MGQVFFATDHLQDRTRFAEDFSMAHGNSDRKKLPQNPEIFRSLSARVVDMAQNMEYELPMLVGGAITILKNDGVRQWEG